MASLVFFPSKSSCARKLRKVYPNAHFRAAERNEKGQHGLELCYKHGITGDTVPVLTVHGPRESALPFVALKAAFARLGFQANWDPRVGLKLAPLDGYVGPEALVPVELDPTATTPEQVREAIGKIDFSHEGVDSAANGA
jgi:hypothetical protein